ncbi:hypothetical protein QZH41_011366, partial [Actinostola sp. cb2023]
MVREVQKENEINSTIHLVHDLGESMHLDSDKHDSPMQERRNSFECSADMFPSPAPSSPSPTRFGRVSSNPRSKWKEYDTESYPKSDTHNCYHADQKKYKSCVFKAKYVITNHAEFKKK